jgi:hypothetical protein
MTGSGELNAKVCSFDPVPDQRPSGTASTSSLTCATVRRRGCRGSRSRRAAVALRRGSSGGRGHRGARMRLLSCGLPQLTLRR